MVTFLSCSMIDIYTMQLQYMLSELVNVLTTKDEIFRNFPLSSCIGQRFYHFYYSKLLKLRKKLPKKNLHTLKMRFLYYFEDPIIILATNKIQVNCEFTQNAKYHILNY